MLIYCFKHETAYDLPISDWSSDVCSADLRGDGPLQCLRFSHRIARHQPVAFAGEMEEAGAAFEYLQPSIVQERNLAEGLALQMIGFAPVERDRADRVGKTGFLTRPAQPQVAHETAREIGSAHV